MFPFFVAAGGGGGGSIEPDDANNLAVGDSGILGAVTSGYDNIGIGGASDDNGTDEVPLGSITSGGGNIAIGPSAFGKAVDCYYNVAIGVAASYANTSGDNNVAIGAYALYANETGNYNVAIGEEALGECTAGSNTAIGRSALGHVTTGTDNFGLGNSAGFGIETGSYNVCIGTNAGLALGTALSKTIGIGLNSTPLASSQCWLGATGSDAVALGFAGATAPADADIPSSFGFIFWDFTNGSPKLKIKAKQANGTVVTGEIALT